ncbi:MAG: hypothetical protein A3F91_02435 [Flavobacteria bacterium RIFCSPLOWO2_12_FULL_35_11]|nr:MAG: hypothetical protein A3F91_02435 [Flavobacteria bacterium RIFCSPLOWO2_12_FULL_35_11]
MEFHPRINIADTSLKESKIILGSFPTWSLSNSDLNEDKKAIQMKNGDVPFFFGSSVNRFWDWYYKYVDNLIIIEDANSIQKSLKANSIGITDLIISCDRKDKSSLDKHLTKRTYNHNFFEDPKQGENIKLLCTSKGVMNEMLLNKKFFKIHPKLKIDIEKSVIFQKQMIQKIDGNLNLVKNPFYRSIKSESGGNIECISIPSPGSPYRRLVDFGFNSKNAETFLDDYLKVAFEWFTK